jgi:hypothetical protein
MLPDMVDLLGQDAPALCETFPTKRLGPYHVTP